MGTPKALLEDPEGRPFVVRIARTFADAGLAAVVVVTGAQHDAVVRAVAADRAAAFTRCVRNPDPSRGQLSSLWVGMNAVMRPDLDAILMTLVDVPMLQPSTVVAVIDAWRRTGAPIVRPAIGDRHGHPVLFDRSVFDELRRAPLDEGAKTVVHAHADRVVNVEVDDEGCLLDIDTKTDYDAIIGKTRAPRR